MIDETEYFHSVIDGDEPLPDAWAKLLRSAKKRGEMVDNVDANSAVVRRIRRRIRSENPNAQ